MKRAGLTLIFTLAASVSLLGAEALRPSIWSLAKPSNTGIPGEEIRFVRFDSNGTPWVGARWPFWSEGGVSVLDRASQIWRSSSNYETPIPSEYVNDLAIGPGGVVWIATREGLVRKEGASWIVYDSSNSPLLHDEIRNIALDSQGHVWVNNSNATLIAALFEFDGETWRSFTVPDDIPWEDPWRSLSTVHVDPDDHVWVANQVLPGVAEYDGSTWTIHGESVAPIDFITHDLTGYIWMIEAELGYNFYRFDGLRWRNWGAHNACSQANRA